MGGKKKAGGDKKKAKADDTPDESVEKFFKLYKKKCTQVYFCDVSKKIKADFD